MPDRYGSDVLAGDWRATGRGRSRPHPVTLGEVVEEVETGWCGAVVRVERSAGIRVVVLQDRHGRTRTFPLGPGFRIGPEPVTLVAPRSGTSVESAPTAADRARPVRRSASGSRVVANHRARVARASRLYVEGRHDAELIEKVWGHDLRVEGVVVEILGGIDDLEQVVHAVSPGPGARMGVLVDHLVPGSKESRIAARVAQLTAYADDVLVAGHPFVDVWQSVRPQRLGLAAWPTVPRHREWKAGICEHLGWAHADQADIAAAWARILGTVRSYADLEPAFLGRVEELIDFVTAPS